MKKIYFITIGPETLGLKKYIEIAKINNGMILYENFNNVCRIFNAKEVFGKHESLEAWKKMIVVKWLNTLKQGFLDKNIAIFEHQVNWNDITKACKEVGYQNYEMILLHCNQEVLENRILMVDPHGCFLDQRKEWNVDLYNDAINNGAKTIDVSYFSEEEVYAFCFLKK